MDDFISPHTVQIYAGHHFSSPFRIERLYDLLKFLHEHQFSLYYRTGSFTVNVKKNIEYAIAGVGTWQRYLENLAEAITEELHTSRCTLPISSDMRDRMRGTPEGVYDLIMSKCMLDTCTYQLRRMGYGGIEICPKAVIRSKAAAYDVLVRTISKHFIVDLAPLVADYAFKIEHFPELFADVICKAAIEIRHNNECKWHRHSPSDYIR